MQADDVTIPQIKREEPRPHYDVYARLLANQSAAIDFLLSFAKALAASACACA